MLTREQVERYATGIGPNQVEKPADKAGFLLYPGDVIRYRVKGRGLRLAVIRSVERRRIRWGCRRGTTELRLGVEAVRASSYGTRPYKVQLRNLRNVEKLQMSETVFWQTITDRVDA